MNWDSWIIPRRTPSFVALLGAIWILSFAAQWLQIAAHIFPGDRFPDLMTMMVLHPLWNVMFLFGGCLLINRALHRPSEQFVLIAWRALPILLLPGLFNLFCSAFGISANTLTYTSLSFLPIEVLTLGTYPQAFASWGVLLTLVLSAVGCFFLINHVTRRRATAVKATILFVFSYILLLAVPSIVGWFGLESATSLVTASPYSVQRGLIFLSQEGYWWKNLYERFPGTGIGEAQASVRFLLGGMSFLSFVVILAFYEWKKRGWSLKKEGGFLKPWGFLFFTATLIFGGVLGLISDANFALRFVNVIALLVLCVTWSAVWMLMIYRNDLFDLPEDESRRADYPLVSGEVDPRVWQARIPLLAVIAGVGSLLLGWPVFVAVFSFLVLQELRYHPWIRLKNAFFPSLLSVAGSALATLLVGWYFVSQDTSVSRVSARFLVSFLLFFALLLAQKLLEGAAGERIKGLIEQKNPNGRLPASRVEGGLIILAYLLLPICLGWWRWLILSVPVGLISAFFVVSSPEKRSRSILWITLFFLISGFFLSLQSYSP